MKYLLILTLTLGSLNALSRHHKDDKGEWKKKWDAMSFEDAKAHKTEMLNKKKDGITKAQGCVAKTTDKKGIEVCMREMHDMHKSMKNKKK